jgi:hypothetical protein
VWQREADEMLSIWENQTRISLSETVSVIATAALVNFIVVGWDWVHLVRQPLIGLLYQSRMIDDECGAVCGMRIGKRNWSTRRKFALVPLCPHESNPGRRGGKVTTNRLSYGTADSSSKSDHWTGGFLRLTKKICANQDIGRSVRC